ncbi:MAG: hypothetical protein GXP08_08075 [Gammaproteobacteria bacterium]|nr:hypothetical protein [Gammaproteobacteria bacterium]
MPYISGELIAVFSAILSIIASFLAIRAFKKVGILVLIISIFLLVGVTITINSKSVGIVYTKMTKYEGGYFSGVQHQYYYTPLVFGDEQLKINYFARNESVDKEIRSSFSGFGVSSIEQVDKLNEKAIQEIIFKKESLAQYLYVSKFTNAMSVALDDSQWHQPKGWAGLNYRNSKIPEGKKIMFILDFSEIIDELKGLETPRFIAIGKDISESPFKKEIGDTMIHNKFTEFKILPNTNSSILYANVEARPEGYVLVRWKIKNEDTAPVR